MGDSRTMAESAPLAPMMRPLTDLLDVSLRAGRPAVPPERAEGLDSHDLGLTRSRTTWPTYDICRHFPSLFRESLTAWALD